MKRGDQYEIKYKPNELFYRLFSKKKCPLCSSKMTVSREKEYIGKKRAIYGAGLGMSFEKANVYQITEYFYCETCNKKFTVTEFESTRVS